MRFTYACIAIVVVIFGFFFVRECAHPCVRYGEEYTFYVMVNNVMIPQKARDCLERQ